jgi:hypothetical protein
MRCALGCERSHSQAVIVADFAPSREASSCGEATSGPCARKPTAERVEILFLLENGRGVGHPKPLLFIDRGMMPTVTVDAQSMAIPEATARLEYGFLRNGLKYKGLFWPLRSVP